MKDVKASAPEGGLVRWAVISRLSSSCRARKSHGKPPPTALWPGDCEQPPGGRVILLPGFKNKGAQTTLRKQWWLRVAVALAVCIRKGQRMAMRCCKIKSGTNKDDLALFMCAPRPPQPQSFTCVLTSLDPCLQQ